MSENHVSHYKLYTQAHKKYEASEKGQIARARYQNSAKGVAARKRHHAKKRIREALMNEALDAGILMTQQDLKDAVETAYLLQASLK